jgi:DNA repair exonuclease SbcCD nuclease subunit
MGTWRFLHVGDVHIGRDRLGGRVPSKDFADAFERACDAAVAARCAFVLIAGDFFDKSRIEPNHLAEGEAGLRKLRGAGIPAVAIEGNHDVVSSYDPRPSWLSYLNRVGLLRLLRTEFRDGQPVMKEWTETSPAGNWIDLGGARIYGAGWFGASTARRLELLAPNLEKRGFTILLLHAGVNGMAQEHGMLDPAQLAVVRGRVDYVALGHIHKRYAVDGYAFNPGALENWDLSEEERYGDEKGYWLVEVDGVAFRAAHHAVPRRPVRRPVVDCTGAASHDELVARVRAIPKAPAGAVVQVILRGLPAFGDAEVDREAVGAAARESSGAFAADVIVAFGRRPGAPADGPLLERDAIADEEIEALAREKGYAGREAFVRGLVRAVLGERTDEEVFQDLRQRMERDLEDREASAPERQVVR